ncbi:MAG: helix-turn-helix domain-containing protein [Planctomycetes bacterium]|nr:helix-turn-helix domain-containing protein [Planctomycetota bacterium]
MMSVPSTLSIQEAADILNVSRTFLIGLLQAGEIPFQLINNQQRVQSEDLMAFEYRDKCEREAAADALAAEAQHLGLGY